MNNKEISILVVDDEIDIVELLSYNLEREGFTVYKANDGQAALKIAEEVKPDLIILDIMMPVMDGVETCRRMREIEKLKNVFIIFLTARTEEYSEVAAFDVGADDYINKPIKPRALLKRIDAMLRRNRSGNEKSSSKTNTIEFGNITIDKNSYTLKIDDKSISIPKKEFELLRFLAENPNTVFSRDELLQSIWGADVYVLARTVDVHIRRIREKIGNNFIKTIKGVGYKFDEEYISTK